MFTAERGADGRGRFDRLILHGADTLDPRSDAFGACFRRAATTFDKNGKATLDPYAGTLTCGARRHPARG